MERNEVESALDNHKLFVRMNSGNYWQLRRNGRTKLWKRDANRWRIPVKAGFRECGEINNESDIGYERQQKFAFVIEKV